jgi:hypothetical protein
LRAGVFRISSDLETIADFQKPFGRNKFTELFQQLFSEKVAQKGKESSPRGMFLCLVYPIPGFSGVRSYPHFWMPKRRGLRTYTRTYPPYPQKSGKIIGLT